MMYFPKRFQHSNFDRDFFDHFFAPLKGEHKVAHPTLEPKSEIYETESGYGVNIELPGLEKEDIQLEIKGEYLLVSGEFDQKIEDKKNFRTERRYGRFSRSFRLPQDVDTEGIEAKHKNGILYLTLPKSEGQNKTKIEISS